MPASCFRDEILSPQGLLGLYYLSRPTSRTPNPVSSQTPSKRTHVQAKSLDPSKRGPDCPGHPCLSRRLLGRPSGSGCPPEYPDPARLVGAGGRDPPPDRIGDHCGHGLDPVPSFHRRSGGGGGSAIRLGDRAEGLRPKPDSRKAPPPDLGPGDHGWRGGPQPPVRRVGPLRHAHREPTLPGPP